jgi:drug/metabolite transporter (DMT)-like permease
VASLAFALSGPLARLARPAHPVFVACGRVALAAMILFAIDPGGVVRSALALAPAHRRRILLCGALLGVHFALFLAGLDRTSLPAAVTLVSLEPVSVVLCALVVHGVRPTRRELIGVLLATAGAAVMASAAGSGEHQIGGDLLVIGAVVLYGFYVATARSLRDALPPRQAGALIYATAALTIGTALVPLGALEGAGALPWGSFLAIFALAVIPTIVGHTSVQAAARHISPAIVALVSPGETLGGLVIGAALLGAVPTWREIAGAVVILAGCTITVVGPAPAPVVDGSKASGQPLQS